MKYINKRVQLELSQRQLDYLQSVADNSGDTVNNVIKDFFYIYLQERMNNKEVVILPIW